MKKIKYKNLLWAAFSFACAGVFHLISQYFIFFGNGLKIIAFFAGIINLVTAFGFNIPYITDNRRLSKNYSIYAFVIVFIIVIAFLFFKEFN